jgi:hypothetical protein
MGSAGHGQADSRDSEYFSQRHAAPPVFFIFYQQFLTVNQTSAQKKLLPHKRRYLMRIIRREIREMDAASIPLIESALAAVTHLAHHVHRMLEAEALPLYLQFYLQPLRQKICRPSFDPTLH